MQIIKGIIDHPKGLTSRLSAVLVAEANHFKSHISLKYGEEVADMKSIMNVLALVISYGEEFVIEIEGPDELIAFKKIEKTLKENKISK